ncbi:sensor histidine kinase [Hydrogenophaga sp. RWCD_12]|uniref:sensor histidine kinase n=1 Tax=Hydrogenophaga sp. RWCD_12 TaxID=3391190 RepID=UPI0039851C9E
MSSPHEFRHPLAMRSDQATSPSGSGGAAASADAAVLGRLVSAEQTLRDISHALAHDLRTSLRHVASYAQLLGDLPGAEQPEQVARLSQKVLDSSRRLQRLMESVSDLARLQVEDLRHEWVDNAALVRSVMRGLDIGGESGSVRCEVVAELPPAFADAGLLRRVWVELLDNAVRHASTSDHPLVEVGHEAVPGGSAYFVHDNGLGFEPERSAMLFGLFQQGAGAPSPGPGVGLAMVRRIVECHGGRVWASNRPGQGASFGFSLPAAAD